MVKIIKKHFFDKHHCEFKASDRRYQGNEAAFPLIGTDTGVQAGFGNIKKRYRKAVKANLEAMDAQAKVDRARHDKWEADKSAQLAVEPEDVMGSWGRDQVPQEDEDWDYKLRADLRELMPDDAKELWDGHKGYQRLPQSTLTVLVDWRDVLLGGYQREKGRVGGADATKLGEWRVRLQKYDDILSRSLMLSTDVDAEGQEMIFY